MRLPCENGPQISRIGANKRYGVVRDAWDRELAARQRVALLAVFGSFADRFRVLVEMNVL
jgi:hypothetical protein